MTALTRAQQLRSPDGRLWVVNSITIDGKVLLERLDKRTREHQVVWKDLAAVTGWERLG